MYTFTEDANVKDQGKSVKCPHSSDTDPLSPVLNNTISGNLVFNDTFQQMDGELQQALSVARLAHCCVVAELPFGGVGESGIGHQQLKYSFDCFTHIRGSVDVPKE